MCTFIGISFSGNRKASTNAFVNLFEVNCSLYSGLPPRIFFILSAPLLLTTFSNIPNLFMYRRYIYKIQILSLTRLILKIKCLLSIRFACRWIWSINYIWLGWLTFNVKIITTHLIMISGFKFWSLVPFFKLFE